MEKFWEVKGQIISKGLLASSNSLKKRTNQFIFTTTTNSFVRFWEISRTPKSPFEIIWPLIQVYAYLCDHIRPFKTNWSKWEQDYTSFDKFIPVCCIRWAASHCWSTTAQYWTFPHQSLRTPVPVPCTFPHALYQNIKIAAEIYHNKSFRYYI